jgi:hypothetical protein
LKKRDKERYELATSVALSVLNEEPQVPVPAPVPAPVPVPAPAVPVPAVPVTAPNELGVFPWMQNNGLYSTLDVDNLMKTFNPKGPKGGRKGKKYQLHTKKYKNKTRKLNKNKKKHKTRKINKNKKKYKTRKL